MPSIDRRQLCRIVTGLSRTCHSESSACCLCLVSDVCCGAFNSRASCSSIVRPRPAGRALPDARPCGYVRVCAELDPRGAMMPARSDKQLSDEQSRSVAALIREELARRRISRQHLADQAKISISTLEKALSGRRPFTLATTIRLEEALGVSLRKAQRTARRRRRRRCTRRARRARLLLAARGVTGSRATT